MISIHLPGSTVFQTLTPDLPSDFGATKPSCVGITRILKAASSKENSSFKGNFRVVGNRST